MIPSHPFRQRKIKVLLRAAKIDLPMEQKMTKTLQKHKISQAQEIRRLSFIAREGSAASIGDKKTSQASFVHHNASPLQSSPCAAPRDDELPLRQNQEIDRTKHLPLKL